MFFHAVNFKSYIPNEQDRITAAKVANEIIATQGSVLFGRTYAGGQSEGFSTTKGSTDTHVGIIIGLQEMAQFAPKNTYVQRNEPTQGDLISALKNQVKILEARVDQKTRLKI